MAIEVDKETLTSLRDSLQEVEDKLSGAENEDIEGTASDIGPASLNSASRLFCQDSADQYERAKESVTKVKDATTTILDSFAETDKELHKGMEAE